MGLSGKKYIWLSNATQTRPDRTRPDQTGRTYRLDEPIYVYCAPLCGRIERRAIGGLFANPNQPLGCTHSRLCSLHCTTPHSVPLGLDNGAVQSSAWNIPASGNGQLVTSPGLAAALVVPSPPIPLLRSGTYTYTPAKQGNRGRRRPRRNSSSHLPTFPSGCW